MGSIQFPADVSINIQSGIALIGASFLRPITEVVN